VGAAFDDPPALQRQHMVSVADGAEAVCNHERCPAAQQVLPRRLNQTLRARIHRRGRLIDDQDARAGQRSAGDGEQLALAQAQAAATFPSTVS